MLELVSSVIPKAQRFTVKTMVSDWTHYYNFIKKLSSFTGGWPYLKPRTKLYRTIFATVILLTALIPQTAKYIICGKDLRCIFNALTSSLLSVVIMVKLYIFQINGRNIRNLTEHLFVDWKDLQTPEEYEIMKSYAKSSKRFSLVYSIYTFTTLFLFLAMSLIPYTMDIILPLNESRPILPTYPAYYFVDDREYFFYIFWHSIVAWEMILISFIVHDCIFVTYVEHVCSLFAVLGLRFARLFYDYKDAVKIINIHSDDVYHKRIGFSVQTHQRALAFAQLLENTFTTPFLIQIVIVTIGMSITLLQVRLQSGTVLETVKYVVYVVAQLLHLFIYNFEGQKLMDHSVQIRDIIYNSSWYEVPAKSQKSLVLIMMKSLRPSFLSAGKVFTFSLESFTAILQTSVSYFTVLATFQ